MKLSGQVEDGVGVLAAAIEHGAGLFGGQHSHLHLAKLDFLQVVHHRQGAPGYGAYCGRRTSSGPP